MDRKPAIDIVTAFERARFGPFQFTITALCALIALLDGFDTQAIAYVAPVIAEDWQMNMASFGPIFGAGRAGLTVGAFVLSPAADRFGRKSVILASMLVFGVFSLVTAWADSFNDLLLYRFLTGVGLGGAMPNIIALTSEYAPARLRATLVTIMFCGFPFGSTLGGLASARLIEAFGWRSVFILGGVAPLVVLAVLVVMLPESLRYLVARGAPALRINRILTRLDPSHRPAPDDVFVLNEPASRGFPVAKLFQDGRARTTLLLWAAFFMNLLVMYFLVSWLPSLLRGTGLPIGIAILSTAILNLGGVVGAIALGRMIDRINPHLVLGSAYAASALFIVIVAQGASNLWILMPATFLAGFGVVGAQIGMNALTAGIYPTAIRSTGVGWALGVGRIGSIIGPVAGGLLLGAGWDARSVVMAAVLPALLASAAVFALRRHTSRTAAAEAPALMH
ncbi:MFS transporter [Tistrella bauzanensis]|uniref:MFS transporter n=1 Tax=Tistrella bauzanensis TaxID=657419 RepID=A0ABQ1IWD4_9PROT|nr:aromatic acid/H+ symport family MFS transporter [Tistrella bauzanensis]GGB53711.1 MFS transporter [Tistrella bauzanensis]